MSASLDDRYGPFTLSREFLEQFEINSSQLRDLIRAKRVTTTRVFFLVALLLSGILVIGLAVRKSSAFVDRALVNSTFGPMFDFGASLMVMLLLLVALLLLLYWLTLSILNALETRNQIASMIDRQSAVIGEMSPYIEGEFDGE